MGSRVNRYGSVCDGGVMYDGMAGRRNQKELGGEPGNREWEDERGRRGRVESHGAGGRRRWERSQGGGSVLRFRASAPGPVSKNAV